MIALAAHPRHAILRHDAQGTNDLMASLTGEAAATVLDLLEQGVFILDEGCHIRFASAAAKRLVEAGRLCTRNGVLGSPSAAETLALRKLVRERIDAGGPPQMVFHRLDELEEPLCIGVAAVGPWSASPSVKPFAIVFATKPSQVTSPERRQLREHFGLTDAQARMAVEIAKGHGLKECARKLNIAVSTARSHLQQIFAKTDTRRQAELVRLICACQFSAHTA